MSQTTMEDSKAVRTKAYAVDRALKTYDARKRLLPSHRAAWEIPDYNRARSERLQRDKVPLWDVEMDDDCDIDVQRELLDEWAQRARDRQNPEKQPTRPPVEAPVEELVVGTIRRTITERDSYEVLRGLDAVIALGDEGQQGPEPHEEWEHVEKDEQATVTDARSYAATLQI